jgi:3-oxoadipate enol-lactonase
MAEPTLVAKRLAGSSGGGDLLVVGPSLGTSVDALWSPAAALLADRFEVVGWDLPGHGASPPTTAPFSVADLAAGVHGVAAASGNRNGRRTWYAGVSLGGAVGLEAARSPEPFAGFVVIASAAKVGVESAWMERADLVRRAGMVVMVEPSSIRWFAPGFVDRHPDRAARLLASLQDADRTSYSLACEALAEFDLRDHLGAITAPVLVAAGAHDVVVPPDEAERTASALPRGGFEVIEGTGHLPPAEAPTSVADLMIRFTATRGAG